MYATEDEDTIGAKLEKMKEAAQAKLEANRGEMGEIEERQQELKKVLYGRFGKSINLEE
jgi:prefoldin subunit 4